MKGNRIQLYFKHFYARKIMMIVEQQNTKYLKITFIESLIFLLIHAILPIYLKYIHLLGFI